MKTYGNVYIPLHGMEVNGEVHVSAALFSGKQMVHCAPDSLWTKYLLPLPGIELQVSGRQPMSKSLYRQR
jgi:hypothetical protein